MDARDLSFRAKRTDGEGWAYGDYIHITDDIGHMYDKVMEYDDEYDVEYDDGCYAVHPRTLGMYTGFQDSKGLRIYDGDILRLTGSYEETDGSMHPHEEIHKIVYIRGCFCVYVGEVAPYWVPLFGVIGGMRVRDGETYEVIGNIHDEGAENEI